MATETPVQHGRRTKADSGCGAPNAPPGARVAASRRQRVPRWRNQTTTAAPLRATADAAKSALPAPAEIVTGAATRPCVPNLTTRTLRRARRVLWTTITPRPSAAMPVSTARSPRVERMSVRGGPKAAPGAAQRARTDASVLGSGSVLGLTTNARPSSSIATSAATSRIAMTCPVSARAPAGTTMAANTNSTQQCDAFRIIA